MFDLTCVQGIYVITETPASVSQIVTNSPTVPSPSNTAQPSQAPTGVEPDQYDTAYDTLRSIGKGAFGFVKLARRRADNTEVGCGSTICRQLHVYVYMYYNLESVTFAACTCIYRWW